MDSYIGVKARFLRASERRGSTQEAQTPLVIEATHSKKIEQLQNILADHSKQILDDITKYGAVLLRGFDIRTEKDFEKAVLSINGMRGLSDVMMSEPGRTLVESTNFVLHTNTLYKTGGTLAMGGFHTENYFVPDVPQFISFFCMTPSWYGGETGLVNTAKLYLDLPAELRSVLESKSYFASEWSIWRVGERYGLSESAIEAFCEENGFPLQVKNGVKKLLMFKPSVIEHPVTGRRAIVLNFSSIPGLARAMQEVFLPNYNGLHWLLHRLVWKKPLLYDLIHPVRTFKFVKAARKKKKTSNGDRSITASSSIEGLFSNADVKLLAEAMRTRFSSFKWRRGDILIIDNLQMAHAGMPGAGPRKLRALIANPIRLSYSADAPGLFIPKLSEHYRGLGAELIDRSATL